MRITLLRHGNPEFELKGKARGRDLRGIIEQYDQSGISDLPSAETIATIGVKSYVVCSHLKRSIDSAKAIGCLDTDICDRLFCETKIPHFDGGFISLPIRVWFGALRLLWFFGFSRNGESLENAKKRARTAAEKLVELAEEHQNVTLVGHGFMNRFIARELRRSGWVGPRKPSKGYWGYGRYEKATIQPSLPT